MISFTRFNYSHFRKKKKLCLSYSRDKSHIKKKLYWNWFDGAKVKIFPDFSYAYWHQSRCFTL